MQPNCHFCHQPIDEEKSQKGYYDSSKLQSFHLRCIAEKMAKELQARKEAQIMQRIEALADGITDD